MAQIKGGHLDGDQRRVYMGKPRQGGSPRLAVMAMFRLAFSNFLRPSTNSSSRSASITRSLPLQVNSSH